MYSSVIRLSLAFTICFLAIACNNTPKHTIIKADDVEENKADTILFTPKSIDGSTTYILKEGVLKWAAKKVVAYPHSGFANIKSAEILINSGDVVRGMAVIDMTSITVDNSVDPNDNDPVQKHLRSADFFDVAKYPTATVKFDEVYPAKAENYNFAAIADLTVKGKSNTINIPFKMTMDGTEVKIVSPAFVFERLRWGIDFRTKALGVVKELIIDDKVPMVIEMTLVPKK